ncbi:MAG: DUF4867 family protein [Eubacteriales bacterium]
MKIQSVFDQSFAKYGQILGGFDVQPIMDTLTAETPLPDGVGYVPSEPALEKLAVKEQISNNCYGGMPVQLGWCNGHNTTMNCLEYHRDSELNLGADDFIMLIAKQDCIVNGKLDSADVEAFFCPAGTLVEVYATTLHYAPCSAKKGAGFQVLIALPLGTNTDKPEIQVFGGDDARLWARNKWLLAHPDTSEAAAGAYVGITGSNIDIADLI